MRKRDLEDQIQIGMRMNAVKGIHLGFDPTEHKIGSNYRFTSYADILKIGEIPRKSSQ